MAQPESTPAGATASAPIRVLLADGQALFRQALRGVFERESDIDVVGEASDVAQVLSEAASSQPDVVLLDERLAVGNAGHTVALLRATVPGCDVVVVASADDDDGLVAAIEAGCTGYVTKDSGLQELLEGTRIVHRGEALIPRRMLRSLLTTLLERQLREREALVRISRLTARERQVLQLLATGANNRGIAQVLTISPDTARTHVQNLLYKLGVHSRLEAARFARQANGAGSAMLADDGQGGVRVAQG
jgi:DNA-binding NarL/FixJ family response regulator